MRRVKHALFVLLIIMVSATACSAQSTQTAQPTQIIEPEATQAPANLPRTEAEVPRVAVQEAKAAYDSGEAIIVDVRSDASYQASHVAGAINIQLGEIETNPTGLNLDKNQWIITYCTWLDEHTSARAAFVLLQNGYTRVTPLLGGFDAWIDAGLPVEP